MSIFFKDLKIDWSEWKSAVFIDGEELDFVSITVTTRDPLTEARHPELFGGNDDKILTRIDITTKPKQSTVVQR